MLSAFIFYNLLIIIVALSAIKSVKYNIDLNALQIIAIVLLVVEILIGIGHLCVTYLP